MTPDVKNIYGHRVRVRVCGLCWHGDSLLLANHRGLAMGDFWAPPGGGLEFGEHAADRLAREFLEETGLQITPRMFRFGCEYLSPPLHAIELFFDVEISGGELISGDDPELPMITDVRFFTPEEIARLPVETRHGIIQKVAHATDLRRLTGFFTI